MKLIMTKIESTNIEMVGYNVQQNLLMVQFKGGSTYVYTGVPQEIAGPLFSIQGAGKYFADNIKGRYVYSKIESGINETKKEIATKVVPQTTANP